MDAIVSEVIYKGVLGLLSLAPLDCSVGPLFPHSKFIQRVRPSETLSQIEVPDNTSMFVCCPSQN